MPNVQYSLDEGHEVKAVHDRKPEVTGEWEAPVITVLTTPLK